MKVTNANNLNLDNNDKLVAEATRKVAKQIATENAYKKVTPANLTKIADPKVGQIIDIEA